MLGLLLWNSRERETELPLGRKFPSKRIFWHLEGNIKGNEIWKEIGRKFGQFEGKRKEILQFELFQ
jgi:hypothetical protein